MEQEKRSTPVRKVNSYSYKKTTSCLMEKGQLYEKRNPAWVVPHVVSIIHDGKRHWRKKTTEGMND